MFVYHASDGALVETFLTGDTRQLAPEPHRMTVREGSRPEFLVKQRLDLTPGQEMELRVTARPCVLMGVLSGVAFAGGLVMTLSGGIARVNYVAMVSFAEERSRRIQDTYSHGAHASLALAAYFGLH